MDYQIGFAIAAGVLKKYTVAEENLFLETVMFSILETISIRNVLFMFPKVLLMPIRLPNFGVSLPIS